MEELDRDIAAIQNGKLSEEELQNYLEIPQHYIQSNVIIQLVKRNIFNEHILNKLAFMKNLNGKPHRMSGPFTLGHLAVVALSMFDTPLAKKLYNESYNSLDKLDKEYVDDLIKTDVFNQ